MKYLVIECHKSYAIVLDEAGRFIKVANLNYEIGQEITRIIPMEVPEKPSHHKKKSGFKALAMAAMFTLTLLTGWQLAFVTKGSVQMQINPDVKIFVNRLERVIDVDGLNEDGKKLVEGYRSFGKTIDEVSDELALLALEHGFLKKDLKVMIQASSMDNKWKENTEVRLKGKLQSVLPSNVKVLIIGLDPTEDDPPGLEVEPKIIPIEIPTEKKIKTKPQTKPQKTQPIDDDDDDDDDDEEERPKVTKTTTRPTTKPTTKSITKPQTKPATKPVISSDEDDDDDDDDDDEERRN